MELTGLPIKIVSSEHVGSHCSEKLCGLEDSKQFIFILGSDGATELREISGCVLNEVYQN